MSKRIVTLRSFLMILLAFKWFQMGCNLCMGFSIITQLGHILSNMDCISRCKRKS